MWCGQGGVWHRCFGARSLHFLAYSCSWTVGVRQVPHTHSLYMRPQVLCEAIGELVKNLDLLKSQNRLSYEHWDFCQSDTFIPVHCPPGWRGSESFTVDGRHPGSSDECWQRTHQLAADKVWSAGISHCRLAMGTTVLFTEPNLANQFTRKIHLPNLDTTWHWMPSATQCCFHHTVI